MKKRQILIFTFVFNIFFECFNAKIIAQIALGAEFGVSWSFMRIDTVNLPPDEYVRYITGYPFGISVSFRPWEKLNFYAGLKYTPKGFQQKNQNTPEYKEIRTGYIELPVNSRFLVGHKNIFWYLEPGVSYLYLISYKIILHQYDYTTNTFIDEMKEFGPKEINNSGAWRGYTLSLSDLQISAGTGMQATVRKWTVSAGFSFEWGLFNFFMIPEKKQGFTPILNRSAVFKTGVHYIFKKKERQQ